MTPIELKALEADLRQRASRMVDGVISHLRDTEDAEQSSANETRSQVPYLLAGTEHLL